MTKSLKSLPSHPINHSYNYTTISESSCGAISSYSTLYAFTQLEIYGDNGKISLQLVIYLK